MVEVFAACTLGPEFSVRHPHKARQYSTHLHSLSWEDRQEDPGACWTASLAALESSRSSETLSLKYKVETQLKKIPDVNL